MSPLNFCLLSPSSLLLELFLFLHSPLLFQEDLYLLGLLLVPSFYFLLLELQKFNTVLHLGQFLCGFFLGLLLLEHLDAFSEHDVFVVDGGGCSGLLGVHLG